MNKFPKAVLLLVVIARCLVVAPPSTAEAVDAASSSSFEDDIGVPAAAWSHPIGEPTVRRRCWGGLRHMNIATVMFNK